MQFSAEKTPTGSTTDERGNSRPVAFMQYRVNGQYIMEGLAASFMFTLGGERKTPTRCHTHYSLVTGVGFILLDVTTNPTMPKLNRLMLTGLGLACVVIAFMATRVFMRMKLPGYLMG